MPSPPSVRSLLRVALAHDWLTGMRGGEAVLERICARYPHAPLYTLFHEPGSVSPLIESHRIHKSLLDRVPGARRHYQKLLPLYPAAVELFDLRAYDLVVSTSHCAIKGLRIRPGAQHLSYVHTPMRYIYDQYAQYFGRQIAPSYQRTLMRLLRRPLQLWDRRTAVRPTALVANSHYVAARIQRHWGRAAEVVHPPVDTERFCLPQEPPARDYDLVLGALVPYKRADLAVRACTQLSRRLVVAGDGPERLRLQRLAGPSVRFVGRVDDAQALRLYQGARALLFAGEEDFGITPLEAQACGTPVVALGKGGALETVRGLDQPHPTGVFFDSPEVEPLIQALHLLDQHRALFAPQDLARHAALFGVERFDRELGALLDRCERLIR